MSARPRLLLPIAIAVLVGPTSMQARAKAPDAAPIEQLWVEPTNLTSRDLFHGPGGTKLAPNSDVAFSLEKADKRGHSAGYDVHDPSGRKWDVKVGEEAQTEVVVSRILWSIGFHQPVVYFVANWRLQGDAETRPAPGRFRLKSDHKVEGEWNWVRNPFSDTREMRGLLAVNVLLNNWDLRRVQNRVFRMKDPDEKPATRFVVQDVGGSLGRTKLPVGSRNDLPGFESQDFIAGVKGGRVKFDYHARHRELFKNITPEDVVWACRLLARLSDRQLDDAFRAAAYPVEERRRFIHKIRDKVKQGLALETRAESGE